MSILDISCDLCVFCFCGILYPKLYESNASMTCFRIEFCHLNFGINTPIWNENKMFTLLLFCIWNELWCIYSFGSRLKLSDKPSLSFNYRDLLVNYNTRQVSPIFLSILIVIFLSVHRNHDHNLPVKVLKFWTTFFISLIEYYLF